MCVKKTFLNMKIWINILLIILYAGTSSIAQINGMSASKLIVPNTETIKVGVFEFEPSFIIANSSKCFNSTGNVEKIGGRYFNSSLNFRITFGLKDNIEVGTSFSSTIKEICVGAKYRMIDLEKISFGLIAGINLPAGNKFQPDTLTDNESHQHFSLGSIFTYDFLEKFSLDAVYSFTFIKGIQHSDYLNISGISTGYNLIENFQIIFEIINEFGKNDGLNQLRTSSVAGFTYTVTHNLIFVLGASYDIYGKNTEQVTSYFSAFTITL